MKKYIDEFKEYENVTTSQLYLDSLAEFPRKAQELIMDCLVRYPNAAFEILNSPHFSKSPIELIFITAYEIIHSIYETEILVPNNKPNVLKWIDEQLEIITPSNKKYIADFAYIDDKKNIKVLIECDGHEFHQKTKEQVEKDNNRTFDLQSMGFTVFRFSGSQIYNNPLECANKIHEYLLDLYKVKNE